MQLKLSKAQTKCCQTATMRWLQHNQCELLYLDDYQTVSENEGSDMHTDTS